MVKKGYAIALSQSDEKAGSNKSPLVKQELPQGDGGKYHPSLGKMAKNRVILA